MQDFIHQIIKEVAILNWLEILAVTTALVYVVLASKGNRWCFLFGLISSTIYVYITFQLHFYFDVAINIYYVFMSYFGWVSWSSDRDNSITSITKVNKNWLRLLLISGVIITLILAFGVDRFSGAELPYLDAFTTIFALIATLMVVKKQLENWLIWIVVDTVACGMYFYKELYFTAILFFIYTIIAIVGYYKWKRLLENN